ncbi:MAG TPA: hypothetical protein VF364_01585 [Candidatus Limnocylindria bacterium]
MQRRTLAALCLAISIAIAGCTPSDDGGQGNDAAPATTPSPTTNDDAGAGDGY